MQLQHVGNTDAPGRRSVRVLMTLCIALALATGALAEGPKTKAAPADSASPAAGPAPDDKPTDKPSAEEAARRALPVVTFEGGQITVGDLEDHIHRQNPFMRKRYEQPEALKELAHKLARFELLAKEAERRGYGNNEAVKQAVQQNAVQAYIRERFDETTMAEAITAEEVSAYYQAHIDEFVQPAMRRASHIVIASEDEAKALLKQALEMDMRAFRQLAKDKSIDEATKLRGGDLRFFTKDGSPRDAEQGQPTVPEAVAKAAFGLEEVGDTHAKLVPVQGGFSIVKLSGIRPASEQTQDDVSLIIRQRLARERRQKAIDARVAALKAELKPEVNGKLVTLVKLDGGPPAAKGRNLPEGFPDAPAPPTE